MDWQFTAEDARVRLKRLYPMILPRACPAPAGDASGEQEQPSRCEAVPSE